MSSQYITAAFCVFFVGIISVTSGLQCYNCRGITNYDPNECFIPVAGKTVLQECQKGEVCEKRVTMVDRLQDVIDRGCSSNCQGRQFVWTDEFQVYCCANEDYCNGSETSVTTGRITLLLTLFLIVRYIMWVTCAWFIVAVITLCNRSAPFFY